MDKSKKQIHNEVSLDGKRIRAGYAWPVLVQRLTKLNETRIAGIPARMQWAGENGYMSSILCWLCLI